MNCGDLKELLSAYADGELVGTQRDFVEEHLRSCADCRATLADYTKTREQLLSLRAVPPIPDIKQATMAKIKMAEATAKLRRWLRPALVGVPIIVILVTVLALYLSGSFSSYKSVFAKAYAATEGLTSYRSVDDEYVKLRETDELVYLWHCEFEFAGPDRYHQTKGTPEGYHADYAKGYPGEYFNETIGIGDQIYSRGGFSYPSTSEEVAEATPTKENTLETLDMLIDIEELPDENIDGTDCYHYKGVVDIEKWLEKWRPELEKGFKKMIERSGLNLDLEQMVKTAENMWHTKEITYEFWIGKDDYLIRQWKNVTQTLPDQPVLGGLYEAIAIRKYYDFNEPIVIEPPLTESGELMEGWTVSSLLEE